MAYNLTAIATNTTGMLGFTQAVNNELMFGYLGVMLLIGIVGVLFMSFMFSTNDVSKSVAATGFIAMGLSFLLRALSLIPNLAMFITLIGAGAAIAFTWKR